MPLPSRIVHAALGGRVRPDAAPSPERLAELARLVAAGAYRVPADEVARAMLGAPLGRGRRPT